MAKGREIGFWGEIERKREKLETLMSGTRSEVGERRMIWVVGFLDSRNWYSPTRGAKTVPFWRVVFFQKIYVFRNLLKEYVFWMTFFFPSKGVIKGCQTSIKSCREIRFHSLKNSIFLYVSYYYSFRNIVFFFPFRIFTFAWCWNSLWMLVISWKWFSIQLKAIF